MTHVFVNVAGDKEDLFTKKEMPLLLMVPTSPAGITLAWHILFFPLQKLYWDRGRTKALCPSGLATDPYVSMEQVRLRYALTHLIPFSASCILIWGFGGL